MNIFINIIHESNSNALILLLTAYISGSAWSTEMNISPPPSSKQHSEIAPFPNICPSHPAVPLLRNIPTNSPDVHLPKIENKPTLTSSSSHKMPKSYSCDELSSSNPKLQHSHSVSFVEEFLKFSQK